MLLPAIENSGDGFGDPARAHEGANPLPILHEVLHSLGAAVGQVVTLCVMEFCDRVRRGAGGEGGRRDNATPQGWEARVVCWSGQEGYGKVGSCGMVRVYCPVCHADVRLAAATHRLSAQFTCIIPPAPWLLLTPT